VVNIEKIMPQKQIKTLFDEKVTGFEEKLQPLTYQYQE